MKRIEFIAPVEAIRGNLSGAQDLRYAENDNKAYEGPEGKVNYARNYTPRFIGAKIAKSGLKYFTVRTKSANHLTAKAKKAMAVLGGAGAAIGRLLSDKSSDSYVALLRIWLNAQELGDKRTFRKFLSDHFQYILKNKLASEHIQVGTDGFDLYNPWGAYTSANTADYRPSQAIFEKFFGELMPEGFTFTVGGETCYGVGSATFSQLHSLNPQVLAETLAGPMQTVSGDYIKDGDTYVQASTVPVANKAYTTTEVAPQ